MPDMCHSRIAVTGPADEVRQFRDRCFVSNNNSSLDFSFQAILPAPKILDQDGPVSHDDAALLALGADPKQIGLYLTIEQVFAFDWAVAAGIRSREDLLAHLEKTDPESLIGARKCLIAMKETGHLDIISWRIEHWGTKWPASSTEILTDLVDHMEFRFATPWAFPQPVFSELGDLFPALRFEFIALDPDTRLGVHGYVMGQDEISKPIAESDIKKVVEWLFSGDSRRSPPKLRRTPLNDVGYQAVLRQQSTRIRRGTVQISIPDRGDPSSSVSK